MPAAGSKAGLFNFHSVHRSYRGLRQRECRFALASALDIAVQLSFGRFPLWLHLVVHLCTFSLIFGTYGKDLVNTEGHSFTVKKLQPTAGLNWSCFPGCPDTSGSPLSLTVIPTRPANILDYGQASAHVKSHDVKTYGGGLSILIQSDGYFGVGWRNVRGIYGVVRNTIEDQKSTWF